METNLNSFSSDYMISIDYDLTFTTKRKKNRFSLLRGQSSRINIVAKSLVEMLIVVYWVSNVALKHCYNAHTITLCDK